MFLVCQCGMDTLSFAIDCFNLSALLHWLLLNSSFIHRGAQWFLVGVGVCLPDLLHILFLEFVFKRSPDPQLRPGISLVVSAIFKYVCIRPWIIVHCHCVLTN